MKQQKGIALITVLIITNFLLILGLLLGLLLQNDVRFLYRSTESKTAYALAESGISSGLWRIFWGPDQGKDIPSPFNVPNGFPDILEEIMGINYYAIYPTDITKHGYTYTTTFEGREIVVHIESEEVMVIPKPDVIRIPINIPNTQIWFPPEVTDIDPNDGKMDIFMTTYNGDIFRIQYWRDADGSTHYSPDPVTKPIASINNRVVVGGMVVEDLDGDGTKELIVATTKPGTETTIRGRGTNFVYVFNTDGTKHKEFGDAGKQELNASLTYTPPGTTTPIKLKTGVRVASTPAVADLDGDRKKEIILTAGETSNYQYYPGYKSYVVVLNATGSVKWIYEDSYQNPENPDDAGTSMGLTSPRVADVDGDGIKEVIVRDSYGSRTLPFFEKLSWDGKRWGLNSGAKGRIMVLNSTTGIKETSVELGITQGSSEMSLENQFGVGDLDNDGDSEVFIGGISDPNAPLTWAWYYGLGTWTWAATTTTSEHVINFERTTGGSMTVKQDLLINLKDAPFPSGLVPDFGELHNHFEPRAIDMNNDNINDTLLMGICTDMGMAININVDPLTGLYTFDYDIDNNPLTGGDQRFGEKYYGTDFPRGLPGLGDIHGTPVALNMDGDDTMEFFMGGAEKSYDERGNIMCIDLGRQSGNDFDPYYYYTIPTKDAYFAATPLKTDVDGDKLNDIIFVTADNVLPYKIGTSSTFTTEIVIVHPFSSIYNEKIGFLKITASAPMIREGASFTSKKKIVMHVAVAAKAKALYRRSIEVANDIGI